MPRLIVIVVALLAIAILVRRIQAMPPQKRRAAYWQLLFGAVVGGVVLLTFLGKMHWLGAALTGLLVMIRQLLPVLIRAVPTLHNLWQKRQSHKPSGQYSEVKTALLAMTLDHASGELNGQVTEGPFKDWLLSDMTETQLQHLLDYCQQHDNDSVQLLTSYLEQRFPEGFNNNTRNDTHANDNGSMNRAEALAVLGLGEDAADHDIITAHRSLMQKLHPDRGGNDYLAAKLNQAKDVLLG